MKNYYQILGVGEDASEQEVKSTFRKLAKKFHPDKNPGDSAAEKRFKEISEAYDVLSDSRKRREYDAARNQPSNPFEGLGFDFSSFFGDFGDIFSARSRSHRAPPQNNDLGLILNLSFWEGVKGCQKELRFSRPFQCKICDGSGAIGNPSSCRSCGGSGRVNRDNGPMRISTACSSCRGAGVISDPCTMCAGRGYTPKQESVKITIPPGVNRGQSIRLAGKGSQENAKLPAGNLIVELDVEQSNGSFQRQELNIHSEKAITFTKAALGGSISVETIRGTQNLVIPRGCSDGSTLVITSGGIKSSKSTGNHYVKLKISFPSELTADQESLLRKLDETL